MVLTLIVVPVGIYAMICECCGISGPEPEPIIARQSVREVSITQSGIVKIQCENEKEEVVQIDLISSSEC